MRRPALLPVAGLALVLALDTVIAQGSWSVAALAALDEPAHVTTAALLLTALGGRELWGGARTFALAALLGSTAIDVDHLPLYLGLPVAQPGGRPYSHSLLTAALLLLAALLVRRWRDVLLGLSAGVLLHLVRDLATGPGIPWAWPVSVRSLLLPYAPYAVLLLGATTGAAVRLGRSVREVQASE